MFSRRGFVACALCAAGGFLATGVEAQNAAPAGVKRTLIQQTDGPVDGYVTMDMRVDIEPGTAVARHTHPGIESTYVVEGGIELTIDGEPAHAYAPGEGFQVPYAKPHSAKIGSAKTVLAITYVVEKGKPLASPA